MIQMSQQNNEEILLMQLKTMEKKILQKLNQNFDLDLGTEDQAQGNRIMSSDDNTSG